MTTKDTKKNIKNNDEESTTIKVPKYTKESESKQLAWFFIIIILVFSAFLIPYFYTQSQKNFDYLGLKWDVIKEGKGTETITFYHTYVPKIYKGENYGTHNLYFRNDPRKNNIETNITELLFSKNYIATMSPEVLKCPNSNLPAYALGDLTLMMPFIANVSGATTDKEHAEQNNIDFANCTNAPAATTIVQFQKGNESIIFISPDNSDCYIIQISDCQENQEAVERFILEILDNFDYQVE